MSTPLQHTQPNRLAELEARRGGLLAAADASREGAAERRVELTRWMAEGKVAAGYDVEADHRVRSLLLAAQQYEAEAAELDEIISEQRGALSRLRTAAAGTRRAVTRRDEP